MWGFQEQGQGQLLEWHSKECRCTWQREPPGNRTVVCLTCTSGILIYASNWVATWRGQCHWKTFITYISWGKGTCPAHRAHRAPQGSATVWSGGRRRSKGEAQARAFLCLTQEKQSRENSLRDWLLWIMLMGSGLTGVVFSYLVPGPSVWVR